MPNNSSSKARSSAGSRRYTSKQDVKPRSSSCGKRAKKVIAATTQNNSMQGSENTCILTTASYNTPQVSKHLKSRTNQKTKSDIPSPGSTLTSVSLSSEYLMASPLSSFSSRINRSRDDCTFKNMNSLTVQSDATHNQGVGHFNSAVGTTPIDINKVCYVNCTYINKHHPPVLLEKKEIRMTKKMKVNFLAMGLSSQLRKVIKVHSPSKMRMMYV